VLAHLETADCTVCLPNACSCWKLACPVHVSARSQPAQCLQLLPVSNNVLVCLPAYNLLQVFEACMPSACSCPQMTALCLQLPMRPCACQLACCPDVLWQCLPGVGAVQFTQGILGANYFCLHACRNNAERSSPVTGEAMQDAAAVDFLVTERSSKATRQAAARQARSAVRMRAHRPAEQIQEGCHAAGIHDVHGYINVIPLNIQITDLAPVVSISQHRRH
jgi:hypothetical protein